MKKARKILCVGLALALCLSSAALAAAAEPEADHAGLLRVLDVNGDAYVNLADLLAALGGSETDAAPAVASGEASGEASGGASGGAVPAPPSAMAQNVEDMKTTAAISVLGGAVELDEAAVEGDGVTAESVSGVRAQYAGIGDWDGSSVFGHFGLLVSDPECAFAVGGAEELYDVDGERYNCVFLLDAEDADETNALGGSAARDDKNSAEGAEGAGVYADVKELSVENVYIRTVGCGRSALHLCDAMTHAVIRDSTIVALGSEGKDSSAPGFICMYASSRPVLIEASGDTYFYNDKLISSDWGVYSLDGCYNANVYIVNCNAVNTVGGYSMYALGMTGSANTCWYYGSYSASAQYGTILCAAGRTYMGALSDATDEALAEIDPDALGVPVLDDGWSYIGGKTNAVTMQADMSSATTVGVFDAKHTVLDTLDVRDPDGEPVADTMELYDYRNDMGVGASHFFLSYIHGSAVCIRSENVDLTLDDCVVKSSTGVAVQSVLGFDGNASGIRVADGTEYYGSTVTVRDMALEGDVRHEDYQRKMVLALENAELSGAVVSGTFAAWEQNMADFIDAEWNGENEELGQSKQTILDTLAYDDAYETVWGVRMSLDADSVWNVTGDSSLYSLEVAKGAEIVVPEGAEIYVDCDCSNADLFYDAAGGTRVDSLGAGSYAGVVILLK